MDIFSLTTDVFLSELGLNQLRTFTDTFRQVLNALHQGFINFAPFRLPPDQNGKKSAFSFQSCCIGTTESRCKDLRTSQTLGRFVLPHCCFWAHMHICVDTQCVHYCHQFKIIKYYPCLCHSFVIFIAAFTFKKNQEEIQIAHIEVMWSLFWCLMTLIISWI